MERILVVVEDVLLIEFFFTGGHGWTTSTDAVVVDIEVGSVFSLRPGRSTDNGC
jgi:hypothetical protein